MKRLILANDAERDGESGFTNISNDGTFSGYGAVFDVPTLDNEIIVAGAFAQTLQDRDPLDIKLLWQHDTEHVIGTWLEIREDKIGLFVRGRLNLKTEKGLEAFELMKTGAIDGLSIGFNVLKSEPDGDSVKYLEIELWEISLVTFPKQEQAQVDNMYFKDKLSAGKKTHMTKDGYLAFDALVGRTGIQLYRGAEVGRPDLETVRVYRPESEVFHKDTIRSMAHKPLTNNHPPVPVISDNWKKFAIGHTDGDVLRDGEYVRIPMLMMDKEAIRDYEAGKRELSLGYTTDLKWGGGTAPGGEEFDATQMNIRINHLALVTTARGGPELRLGDNNDGDQDMLTKKITLDGMEVEVLDASASVINRVISGMTKQIENLQSALTKEEEAKKAAEKAKDEATVNLKTVTDTKDAEIVTIKKQLEDAAMTPAKLDTLVKERSEVIGKAQTVLGDKLVSDGKTITEIQKQVVVAHLGDTAKDWNEVKVAASFDTLTADIKGDVLADALSRTPVRTDARDTAYNDRNKRLTDAWKPAVVAKTA